MKKIILITYYLLLIAYLKSQNLVPNNSFENYISCPSQYGQVYLATPWFQPCVILGTTSNSSSCELFNPCSSFAIGVPSNACGYQNARTGNGYAGFYSMTDTNNYREYIEVPLLDTLIANNKYCVEFYVSLSGKMKFAISNLGAYFSNDSLLDTTSYRAIDYVSPQVENPTVNMLNDTANWMLVSGFFIANGGEKFMTIGNFHTPANTNSQNLTWGSFNAAYYYIEDVSVTQCNVGVAELGVMNDELGVYPNPSDGFFTLESRNKIKSVAVYNVLGEVIRNYELGIRNENTATIDISKESKGIYFIEVKTVKGVLRNKVVVK